MKTVMNKLRRFIKNEDGAEVLEVAAIVVGAIAVVAIIAAIYSAVATKAGSVKTDITNLNFKDTSTTGGGTTGGQP